MPKQNWPEPPEHRQEICVACTGTGIMHVLDKDENESLTQCPVCNGVGTV